MKKLFIFLAIAVFMSSCIFTKVKAPNPFFVNNEAKTLKVGTSNAAAYVGIVALGDASIEKAAKEAGITKIHHVDYQVMAVLMGIYAKYTVYVYGE